MEERDAYLVFAGFGLLIWLVTRITREPEPTYRWTDKNRWAHGE